jgi:hypothetical protein
MRGLRLRDIEPDLAGRGGIGATTTVTLIRARTATDLVVAPQAEELIVAAPAAIHLLADKFASIGLSYVRPEHKLTVY